MKDQFKALKFGAGGVTSVHPGVMVAVVVVVLAILCLKRKYVVLPFIAAALLIPMDQAIEVAGRNVMMLRIMILAMWARIIPTRASEGSIFSGGMNGIDKAVLLYAIASVATFTLLWGETSAFINHLGLAFNVLGMYCAMRFYVRDEEDVHRTMRVMAVIVTVVALIMLFEQYTGRSPYAVLGGAKNSVRVSLQQRDGRYRAMAAFSHSILAGTFGATTLPLFVGELLRGGQSARLWVVGVVSCLVIVGCSASSTPIMAAVIGCAALCMWPIHGRMKAVRWTVVIALLLLQVTMKAPVWALIGRMGLVGGSSGYHRYLLVDRFITHFGEWFLLGTRDHDKWGSDMWDAANQFVSIGWDAGILPLMGFVASIVYGFKYLGRSIQFLAVQGGRERQLFFWAVGSALFAHVTAFFGASYFDQMRVPWYLLLAMISVLTLHARTEHPSSRGADV